MKHFGLIFGVALVSIVAAAMAADQPTPTPFKIEVDLSSGTAKMRCIAGCTWVTTSYSCGTAEKCSFAVDETGVAGLVSAGR
jgi:hypothetical protein